MSGVLRCCSFHSVKGGVGKSTLSTLTALALARRDEGPVYLLDMDLTGTSLADVLPLQAPSFPKSSTGNGLDLLATPSGFLSERQTREQVRLRGDHGAEMGGAVGVPFLNDYLLFANPEWDEARDIAPERIGWSLIGGPEQLRVLPSSALPRDLSRILPVIFDEEHSSFLEGRLEYLLAGLIPEQGTASVIIDVPPTIPGLSRAVLGLAMRLGQQPKVPLSMDGGFPPDLEAASLSWRAVMLSSIDIQDLRAMARWVDLASNEELATLRLLINRAPQADPSQREHLLMEQLGYERPDPGARRAVTGPPDAFPEPLPPLLDDATWLEEGDDLRIFRRAGEISDAAVDRVSELLDDWG